MASRIVGNVYEEDDYSVFRRLPENRDLSQDRIKKLVASIMVRFVNCPIVVNEKMEVIDGQGRFDAEKELGLPIRYVVDEGATIEDCRRMNHYNAKWTEYDFVDSYARGGNENYQRLLKTREQTKLPINAIMRLSNKTRYKANDKKVNRVIDGTLVFTTQDMGMVYDLWNCAKEIIRALDYNNKIPQGFFTAVKICAETEGYSHDRMKRGCEKSRDDYVMSNNLQGMLKELEKVYNKGYKAKDRVYFSDYMRNKGYNVRPFDSYSIRAEKPDDRSTLASGTRNRY